MTSPGITAWSSGTTRCALGVPNAVAAQVANAMTKWEEHLLYRSDRKADRRETTARISTLAR